MTNPTKVVPVEPTEEMVKAAYLAPHEPDTDDAIIVYKAMIAAAPPASTLPDTNPDADEAADRLANELRGDWVPVEPFQEGSQSLIELRRIFDILDSAPELNPSNYDHEGVCELNARTVEAYLAMRDLLRALPAPPASILDDLEGLQRWNPLVGHPNPDGEWVRLSDLNAIIEKHRSKT